MSDAADFGVCPRCGSGRYDGGVATAVRTCRECGARYRPAPSGFERGLVAAVIIGPSLLGMGVAVAGLVLAITAPPRDNGAVVMGLICFGIFGTASTAGLVLGARELRRRPGAVLFDPADAPGRAVPADRAAVVVRDVARARDARHIVKQLGRIRPDRVARARTRFARAMTEDEIPLVLVDTSFLRNGRAGLLLTNRAVYSSRLPGPIALEAVETVRHRPPDRQAAALAEMLFFVGHFFPPLLLLLVFVVFRKRDRKTHALLVNDRVAFAGNRNLVWGFWVDALLALRAELGEAPGPTRVAVLEVLPGDPAAEPPRVTAPPWEAIERSVRALDGLGLRGVRLWAGAADQSTGLEVLGGTGRYALRELPDGWVYYDPDGGDEEVELGAGHRCPGYAVCRDVERVLAVARGFAATGSFDERPVQ